jgi:alcohol dehydrogenase (cytochrome c)
MQRFVAIIVIAAASAALGACAPTSPQGGAPIAAATSASSAAQWPMYNGTYAATRYSSLNDINRSNVGALKRVCTLKLNEGGAFQAGPVIAGGVAYVTTMHDTYAINATNCRLLWRSTYKPSSVEVFNTNRGVAFDGGRLFRDTEDAHLIALDAKSGSTVWNVQAADSTESYFLSAAPIVWNGKVYVGAAGADWGSRGRMMAFDESSGARDWSFDLIPTGAEYGSQSWGRASSAVTGGGSTWTSYSLDPQTGELFVPVGNPAPDFSGDYRPGANLFSDSLVVLDANTGALKWYYQAVPHDTHDYDIGAAPALITTKGGKNLVVFAGKGGYLYALDRASHGLVYKVPVTTIKNADLAPTIKGVHVCPGWLGGVEWNGPAFDPASNEIIVGANDWCGSYTLAEVRFVAGKFFTGGTFIPDPYQGAHGWVTAFDADSGAVVWKDKTFGPALAGMTPTAGGIVFTGDMSGMFYAFDAASGRELYKYMTSGAMAGGVVAYQENGKEYVIADSGNVSRSLWADSAGLPTIYIFSR